MNTFQKKFIKVYPRVTVWTVLWLLPSAIAATILGMLKHDCETYKSAEAYILGYHSEAVE